MGAAVPTHIVALVPVGLTAAAFRAVPIAHCAADGVDVLPIADRYVCTAAGGTRQLASDLRTRCAYRRLCSGPHYALATVVHRAFGLRLVCIELPSHRLGELPRVWSPLLGGHADRWQPIRAALIHQVELNGAILRALPPGGHFTRRAVLRDGAGPELGDYLDAQRRVHPLVTREVCEHAPDGLATVASLEWDPRQRRYVRGPRSGCRVAVHHLRDLMRLTREHAHLVHIVGIGGHDRATTNTVYSCWSAGGTLADAAVGDAATDDLRRAVLVGACHGLRYLNQELRYVHHRIRPAAIHIGAGGRGIVGDLWDASPVSTSAWGTDDRTDGLYLLKHHTVACDQAALLLCIVSVLSGVDWTAFLASNPPSLRLYRDLVHLARHTDLHPDLLTDLDLLCDAFPATLSGGTWGPYSALYRRMVAALRSTTPPAPLPARMCRRATL